MAISPDQDYVLKTIKERGIHFIRFWFTDVLGNPKSFAVTPSEIPGAFEEGMGFDGSSIEGFAHVQESDMIAMPDASTFQVLPWRPTTDGVARMFCDILTPDGQPFEGDPRYALRRMVEKAGDLGYTANFGPELEFFYFKDSGGTEVLDHGGYFDLTTLDSASDLRRDTVLTLEKMGISVEYSHHEASPSQHEIDLRYDEALSMADSVMTYRSVVKEVANKHGVFASFMPKPLADLPGNGMHVHMSLFNDEGNTFFDAEDPDGFNLSATAKHYIAGLLKYAPEYCAITNQYVNSYKRLIPGYEAPVYLSWANRNRSAMVRVPMYKPGKEMSCRVELRNADPAANPYLAFAVMLGAGLKGIEDELPLMPPADGVNIYEMSAAERKVCGYGTLPASLGEAIDRFEESELMKEILGEHIHHYFVESKRREWNDYCTYVSQWELDRYLEVL